MQPMKPKCSAIIRDHQGRSCFVIPIDIPPTTFAPSDFILMLNFSIDSPFVMTSSNK